MAKQLSSMLVKEGYGLSDSMRNDIQFGGYKQLKHAENKLFRWDMKYREKKGRKWITMLIGMVTLGLTGWFVVPYTNKL